MLACGLQHGENKDVLHWGTAVTLSLSLRAQCVTCCGRTLMIVVGGVFLPEVLATPLDRTSLKPSTTPTASPWCPVPISWSWR